MNPNAEREMMARKVVAIVVVMFSCLVTRLRRIRAQLLPVSYGPRSREQHRLRTLQMIFNNTNVKCLAILRMTRAPFFARCNLFRG
jgi:hypothetical protein